MDRSVEDCEALVSQMLSCARESRYLTAYEYLVKLDDIVESNPDNKYSESLQKILGLRFSEHGDKIANIRTRHEEVVETLKYHDDSSDWVLGSQLFGITTYYKYNAVDGSLLLKLEGLMDNLPLFEQIAVVYEIDLLSKWVPFCNKSVLVDKISVAELIPYISIHVPPIVRDTALHCYGADCLHEHGKLLLIGKSINNYPNKYIPFSNTGFFQDRMIVKHFKTISEVQSPTSAKTTIIADINPNCTLPQSLLNFVIKNIAGVVLNFFQKQVMKVSHDWHCEHAKRIRANTSFYTHWVLPKLRELCTMRGWDQPTILSLRDGRPKDASQSLYEDVIRLLEDKEKIKVSKSDMNFDDLYIC